MQGTLPPGECCDTIYISSAAGAYICIYLLGLTIQYKHNKFFSHYRFFCLPFYRIQCHNVQRIFFKSKNKVKNWSTLISAEKCLSLALEYEFRAIISLRVNEVNISGALEHYPELLGKYVKVGKIFHIICV